MSAGEWVQLAVAVGTASLAAAAYWTIAEARKVARADEARRRADVLAGLQALILDRETSDEETQAGRKDRLAAARQVKAQAALVQPYLESGERADLALALLRLEALAAKRGQIDGYRSAHRDLRTLLFDMQGHLDDAYLAALRSFQEEHPGGTWHGLELGAPTSSP